MPINNFSPTQAPTFAQTPTGAAFQAFGSMNRGAVDQALAMQEQAKAAIAPQMAKQSLDQAVQSTLQSTIHTQVAKQHLKAATAAAIQATKLINPTVALKYYQSQVQNQLALLHQKQQGLVKQQTQLAKAKTSTATTAAQVAKATKGYAIQQSLAAAAQKTAQAKTAKEHAKYLPSEIAAKNVAAVSSIYGSTLAHPGQRVVAPGPMKNAMDAINQITQNPLAVPTNNINSNTKIPETNTPGKINGYSYTKTRMKKGVKQYFINGHYYSVAAGK